MEFFGGTNNYQTQKIISTKNSPEQKKDDINKRNAATEASSELFKSSKRDPNRPKVGSFPLQTQSKTSQWEERVELRWDRNGRAERREKRRPGFTLNGTGSAE